MLTILNSTIDITGRDLYHHFINTRIYTLKMNMIFIQAPKT